MKSEKHQYTRTSADEPQSYKIRTRYRNYRQFYKKSEIRYPGSDTPVLSSDSPVSDSIHNYVDGFDVDRVRRQLGFLVDETNPQSPKTADLLVPETDCTSDGYHEMIENRTQIVEKQDVEKESNRKQDVDFKEKVDNSMPPLEDNSTNEPCTVRINEPCTVRTNEQVGGEETENLFVPQPMYVPEFRRKEPRKRKLSSDDDYNPFEDQSSDNADDSGSDPMQDVADENEDVNRMQHSSNTQTLAIRSDEVQNEQQDLSVPFASSNVKLCCFFVRKLLQKTAPLKDICNRSIA